MLVPPAVVDPAAAAGLYAAALKNILGFRVASPMKKPSPDCYNQELAGFYVEAARRLPIAEIPYLADCISMGGLAVGLAEPITNIVLTTIDAFANSPCSPRLCVRPLKPADALQKTSSKHNFAVPARNSRAGLVAFLLCYFRHLTVEQATKILNMAGHSLPLAVLLVELGCWGLDVPPPPLQPDAARTRTALQQAGDNAGQCSITGDSLVRLMTARYHLRHLLLDDPAAILHDLRAGNKLTSDSIYKICHLLRRCSSSSSTWPPPPQVQQPTPAPGTYRDASGNVTTILKVRKDIFATTTISKDLVATTTFHSTSSSCTLLDSSSNDDDDAVHLFTELATDISSSSLNTRVSLCRENPDFLTLLKISLLDTVHGFYIEALGLLPTHALREGHLVRSILAAGHCYGPLDPVSNIIVNSIWYDAVFQLSEHVSNQIGAAAADILGARSLSRVESRSLDRLVAFVCYTYSLSEQQAVVLLCEHRFNLSYIFQGGPEKISSDFAAGALVAKHPQPAAFGNFLSSLIPAKLDGFRSLIYDNGLRYALSGDALEQIKNLVTNETTRVAAAAVAPSMAPDLGKSALDALSARREAFKSRQDYVRTKLEKLLLDYCRDKGHFYELGIVCGVTTQRYGFYSTCYHINFLASKDVPTDSTRSWALFFAEFWSIVDSDVEHSTNVPFCCPVRDSFNVYSIRCGICDQTSCKIAHPSCGEYVYFTGNTEYDFPVYHEWGSDLGGMLESDFMYFDRESDDEFAKILSEESSSSLKKPRAREESSSSQRNTRARTGAGFGAPATFRKV